MSTARITRQQPKTKKINTNTKRRLYQNLKLLILILTIITLILGIIRNFSSCSASGDIPNGLFQIDVHATPETAKPPAEESKFWLELLELWQQAIGSSP